MKATEIVKNKGLDYAKNIVLNSPENALYWVEGYEFKCGQSANDLSEEIKEKYFVSIPELKDVLKSHDLVESKGGLGVAKMLICVSNYGGVLEQAITDVESCQ